MPLGSVISVRSWKKNMQKGSRLGDSREGSEMAHSELYERRISDQRRRDCVGGKRQPKLLTPFRTQTCT